MRKILVTGGAGFIGSHTVVLLNEAGFDPIIVDDFSNSERTVPEQLEAICGRPIQVYEADCADPSALSYVFDAEPDLWGAIHFAAFKAVGESVREPLKYYRNNVGSLALLVETMQARGVQHLVFSSSCTVYGQPDQLPVTEETPLQPANSPYGYTKQVCERMLRDVARSGASDFNSVLLRYFNPIGAHPSSRIGELPLGVPENLVPYITQTAAGLRDHLTVFGNDYSTTDGTCVRDYIHVMDLAAAHVSALKWMEGKSATCEAFNIGTGQGNTVLEVIESFERVSGHSLNYNIGARRPGDVEQIFAGADKAARELGWKTQYSLDDAMRDAWNWQCKLHEIPREA
jgi:UDP-glucose 4-epimerase